MFLRLDVRGCTSTKGDWLDVTRVGGLLIILVQVSSNATSSKKQTKNYTLDAYTCTCMMVVGYIKGTTWSIHQTRKMK